ncbi:MAG: metal-sensitive transcriptional regulator [Candidatus Omnitrophota bacterium]
MKQLTTHEEQLESLEKVEGQVRAIKKMIIEKRYCVDIINQILSIIGALNKTRGGIFKKHIEGCVVHAFKGKSGSEKKKKLNEVLDLVTKFRKNA